MSRSFLLALLLSPGCTWVTQEKFDERLLEVDDDGDGVPAAEDCDDHDAAISPALLETWYDGIDNDCGQDDDYDQDGDRFVPAEYVGLATEGVDGSGALEGGDCDDTVPTVSPIQPDAWYDGLDQDCDGRDDYDQDEDGFVPSAYAGLPTQNAPGTGGLPGDDCDDLAPRVNPSAQDEWYDGVDTDCGGEDDWDADRDNFVPTELYNSYTTTIYAEDSTGILPNGDCDDTLPNRNPAEEDAWYDGFDADCGGEDEYDQDGDGFQSAEHQPDGLGTDCDDVDAAVYPNGRETLGDRADGDCDGDPDTFVLDTVDGYTWTGPFRPIFAADASYVYLSVGTMELETSTVHYYDSALALAWDIADVGAGVDGLVAWNAATSDPTSYALTGTHDFVVDGGYLYGALGIERGTSRSLWIARYDTSTGRRLGLTAQGTDAWDAYDDVSLVVQDGTTLHAVGCEAGTGVLHYVQVQSISAGVATTNEEAQGVFAEACGLDLTDGGHVLTGEAGGIVDYAFDPAAPVPEFVGTTWSGVWHPLDLDVPSDATTRTVYLTDEGTGSLVLLDADLSATMVERGTGPVTLSVHEDDDGTTWLGWVDATGGAHVTWGDPASGWTTLALDAGFAAEDVAVWTDGGYLLYAVVGADQVAFDVVGLP